jgi:hypothetical protein
MEIDALKYGFSLSSVNGDGIKTFVREFDDNVRVKLKVLNNNYTIKCEGRGFDLTVANRYTVINQEQFDYLILCGRVGHRFAATG